MFLSAYSGSDVFGSKVTEPDITIDGGLDWGNLISALRWNYQISNKLFCNTTLTYSKYDLDIGVGIEEEFENTTEKFSARYLSGIQDYAGKIDFDFIPTPNHYLRFGIGATRHRYSPGALSLKGDDGQNQLDTLIGNNDVFSREYDIYVEDEIQIGKLKANIGLHGSAFDVKEKTYFSLQPRIGLRYLLPKQTSLKASFATMTQFINLLTSEAASLPTDLWVPSTARIQPQDSWQVALGIAKTFKEQFEISFEAYYKEMNNVISFKEGASFLLDLNNDWQDKVTQGTGESYGAEFFIQKKTGKTTGWLGYTLSWNNRQFDFINGGKSFPFRYDRRHDISLVLSHDINKRISASAAWIFGTGNAVTLPILKYPVSHSAFQSGDFFFENFSEIESLGEKNAFRMSNYHRLDVSIEIKGKKKRFEGSWVIGCYNIYNHNNPYYLYSDEDYNFNPNTGTTTRTRSFKEVSILPFIPSIAYNFKFQ